MRRGGMVSFDVWEGKGQREHTEKIRVELNVTALVRILRRAGNGRVGEHLDGGIGCVYVS